MMPLPTTSRLIRFGTFQVDLRTGELHKNGLKIKLQEQPFRILAMLLDHAGDIVTRDELRHRLWPEDTFVDFDQGLNKAINKIREALGDSAENPRFVETLPKRGYRFIAPINGTNRYSEPTESADDPQPQAGRGNRSESAAGEPPSGRRAIGLRSAAALGTGFLLFHFRRLLSSSGTD
ncbi:MAG: transcriptional regulator [Terriglobia bacterium]